MGEAQTGVCHGPEFLVEETEELGRVHRVHLGAKAVEAFAHEALAAKLAMIAGVVVAEALTAHGDTPPHRLPEGKTSVD